MSAVDLTNCRRGDLLTLRDGRSGVFLAHYGTALYQVMIHIEGSGLECITMTGRVYDEHSESPRDAVAIIHPTRAELEEQRRELLEHLKITSAWMRWWINQSECDCDGPHHCGLPDRERECQAAQNEIIKAEATHEL